jgi:putative peptide zinc metalloprotease protein
MSTDTEPSQAERWCRATGLRELGSAQGSGLREPRFLLRRGDGQVVQVSELLQLVLREVSPERDEEQVAAAVSAACGRRLTAAGLHHLITTKLQPLALVQAGDVGRQPPAAVSTPLLSLRLRATLVPERAVRTLARAAAPLFRPTVIALALAGLVVADLAAFGRGSIVGALDRVFATPTFLLALLGLITAGALVHELGHAAACQYGGARPGVIGAGVYLVFPAFFTNVTDSYRLDRIGRIRTDLGGLYFQVWCLLALDGLFLWTGQGLFLLAALLMHVEMAQQLIPTVRFDGYFILADLAGVPDLFSRVGPVLLSLLPGRPDDPRVSELRPAARRIVTLWVLAVVPTLLAGLGWLVYSSPYLVRHTAGALSRQDAALRAAWHARDLPAGLLAAVSIALLLLPVLGLLLLLRQLVAGLARRLARRFGRPAQTGGHRSSPPGGLEPDATQQHDAPAILDAAAFSDEHILHTGRTAVPESGWRRAVFSASRGSLNPGPSALERRRADVHARVTAPIDGSRRVVVLSRKGGVGKTTVTLALGSTFAMERGDRVIAVDANPDAGNLAHRVAPEVGRTITEVLDDIDSITSYSQLRRYTAQSPESRLEVLASDDDPRISQALTRREYQRVIELLDHYYNLILLDSGTGILDSANQGLLGDADQVVLVLRPAVDGARAAALTLDWLSEHGYGELVARAVVVINGVRPRSRIPVERIADHFTQRCARVVTVGWDPALETGARTRLGDLRPATRQSLVELAAAVADHFAGPERARRYRTDSPLAAIPHEEF